MLPEKPFAYLSDRQWGHFQQNKSQNLQGLITRNTFSYYSLDLQCIIYLLVLPSCSYCLLISEPPTKPMAVFLRRLAKVSFISWEINYKNYEYTRWLSWSQYKLTARAGVKVPSTSKRTIVSGYWRSENSETGDILYNLSLERRLKRQVKKFNLYIDQLSQLKDHTFNDDPKLSICSLN